MKFITKILTISTTIFLFTSCFTGVEGTKTITDKDVANVTTNTLQTSNSEVDKLHTSNFSTWQLGKKFHVTDNQIARVLRNADNLLLNDVNLKGEELIYNGYTISNVLGNKGLVIIEFADKSGNKYFYNTNHSHDEILKNVSNFSIPFTVEDDMVNRATELMTGKEFYILSPVWYDADGNSTQGEKFIKVKIKRVMPGNKVYSFNVEFTYNGKQSYIFLSTIDNSNRNRMFSNIFSTTDPHKSYPTITDENWNRIIKGEIATGMTKDECRLSIGTPVSISTVPTYNGLSEMWQYNNGIYLMFVDGILTQFRK